MELTLKDLEGVVDMAAKDIIEDVQETLRDRLFEKAKENLLGVNVDDGQSLRFKYVTHVQVSRLKDLAG